MIIVGSGSALVQGLRDCVAAAAQGQARTRSHLAHDVDRDLNCGNGSLVLEPVQRVAVLRPTQSRPVVRIYAVAMVGDRPLQYVDGAGAVLVVVDGTEYAPRLDRHHAHSKLPPCHTLDFGPKVDRRE